MTGTGRTCTDQCCVVGVVGRYAVVLASATAAAGVRKASLRPSSPRWRSARSDLPIWELRPRDCSSRGLSSSPSGKNSSIYYSTIEMAWGCPSQGARVSATDRVRDSRVAGPAIDALEFLPRSPHPLRALAHDRFSRSDRQGWCSRSNALQRAPRAFRRARRPAPR